jgi:hypothetical protein
VKVGDIVRHRRKGWIGKILEISSRTPGVVVDLSDKTGVMVRTIHRNDLEVVEKKK